jgi:hypothetical protein
LDKRYHPGNVNAIKETSLAIENFNWSYQFIGEACYHGACRHRCHERSPSRGTGLLYLSTCKAAGSPCSNGKPEGMRGHPDTQSANMGLTLFDHG